MLTSTFCHIPGIGAQTERQLWAQGLRSWQAVNDGGALPLPPRKTQLVRQHIAESASHLSAGQPGYFYQRLPADQHWRMFPEFQPAVAYLDIETTGLGGPDDYITTIVLYDGKSIRHYVHGDNLEDFGRDIAPYSLLVTYNGKTFDIPFIRNSLGLAMDQAHIDLRYVLASLGYRGGLKQCERRLGLDRKGLRDVDGFFAVLLWDDYRKGNAKALDTLLAYNTLDVINLATLMPMAYNMKIKDTPFAADRQLAIPTPPELPFQADIGTIERIRRRQGWQEMGVRRSWAPGQDFLSRLRNEPL